MWYIEFMWQTFIEVSQVVVIVKLVTLYIYIKAALNSIF